MDKELKTLEPKREMPLVNKIKDIKYLIAENYSDKEPLTDCQKKSRDVFYRYCKDIEKALERKEKLEKAIQLFHDKCDFVYNPKKKMWEFTDMEYFDEEEIKIIDEVFGNATR